MAEHIRDTRMDDYLCDMINEKIHNGCNHEYSTNNNIPLQTKKDYCTQCIINYFKNLPNDK